MHTCLVNPFACIPPPRAPVFVALQPPGGHQALPRLLPGRCTGGGVGGGQGSCARMLLVAQVVLHAWRVKPTVVCPTDLGQSQHPTLAPAPQTVSEPMDFGTMKDKAERGGYRDPQQVGLDWGPAAAHDALRGDPGAGGAAAAVAGSAPPFQAPLPRSLQVYTDFMLVFNNSRQYNPPGSDVYYMSTVLQVRAHEGAPGACAWQRSSAMQRAAACCHFCRCCCRCRCCRGCCWCSRRLSSSSCYS